MDAPGHARGGAAGIAALAAEQVAGWLAGPRRSVWAGAMLSSLLLAALSLAAPGLLPDVGIVPVAAPPAPAAGADALPAFGGGAAVPGHGAAAGSMAWWTDPAVLLGLGWLAASGAALCVVAGTYRRLRIARDRGVVMELEGGEVRVTERVGPAVVGLLHPAVIVPAGCWTHRRRSGAWCCCTSGSTSRRATRGCSSWARWPSRRCPGARRWIVAMTTRRPSHPLLRSLPLLALAAGVAAAACDVAGEAPTDNVAALGTAPPGAFQRTGPTESSAVELPDRVSDTSRIVTDTMAATPDPSRPQARASTGFVHAFPIKLEGSSWQQMRVRDYYRIARVRPGTGAARAGLRPGDVILAVNGTDARVLRNWISLLVQEPGTRYVLRIRRGGGERDIAAELDPVARGEPLM